MIKLKDFDFAIGTMNGYFIFPSSHNPNCYSFCTVVDEIKWDIKLDELDQTELEVSAYISINKNPIVLADVEYYVVDECKVEDKGKGKGFMASLYMFLTYKLEKNLVFKDASLFGDSKQLANSISNHYFNISFYNHRTGATQDEIPNDINYSPDWFICLGKYNGPYKDKRFGMGEGVLPEFVYCDLSGGLD